LNHIPRAVLRHHPTEIAPDLLICLAIKGHTARFGKSPNQVRVLFAEKAQCVPGALRCRSGPPGAPWPNIEPTLRRGDELRMILGLQRLTPVFQTLACRSNDHVCYLVGRDLLKLQSQHHVQNPALTFLAVLIEHLQTNARLELESIRCASFWGQFWVWSVNNLGIAA
jgi:hypothetical protein